MLENKFQSSVIKELKKRFPDCIVLKNDANYLQGVPDLMILYEDRWASLECKKDGHSAVRPNQEYYVRKMDNMSFSRFIFPENREEVMHDLELAFKSGRKACSS